MSEPFKIGIVFADGVPLEQVAPGYEYLEIPLGNLMIPFESDAVWNATKAPLLAQKLPIPVCSHFFHRFGLYAIGLDADWEQLEFWTRRALKRCADVGVNIAGVYGGFFPCPAGADKTKLTDEAIKYLHMAAGYADQYGVTIALEPQAGRDTLFPGYLDGLRLAKETGKGCIRVMADLNYFIELPQPLEIIAQEPEYCMHVHIQGDGGAQPNVGGREQLLLRLFAILKDMGYTGGVSNACPWVSTTGGALDLPHETAVALEYVRGLRDRVYGL